MKNITLLFLVTIFCTGCFTTKSEDYINKRYSQIDRSEWISRKDALVIAQKHLLDSEYFLKYQLYTPELELPLHMPLSKPYFCITFKPAEDNKDQKHDYLVVIDPFVGQIKYAGLFDHPQIDPFYKYQAFIEEITLLK